LRGRNSEGHPTLKLRDVSCDFSGGVLTLRGRVPSYHLKQLAQSHVAEVPGVLEVDNCVEVVSPGVSHHYDRRQHEAFVSVQNDSQ